MESACCVVHGNDGMWFLYRRQSVGANSSIACSYREWSRNDIEEGQKISEYAVVINNQISPDYKNKDLTGAGVTWQFCRYIDQMLNTNFANELIDLAALGVCGDMGSILNLENRYIMQTGFNNITNFFF